MRLSSEHNAPELDTELNEYFETEYEKKYVTILFNDDFHTFEEVIRQVMKAVKCSREVAETATWKAHTDGKAPVAIGPKDFAVNVAAILEEINLTAKVEQA